MIVLAADHGGFHLKEEVKKYLEAKGVEILDVGAFTPESVDYPDMAVKGCEKILSGEATLEELSAYACEKKITTNPDSGRQEYLQTIVNQILF